MAECALDWIEPRVVSAFRRSRGGSGSGKRIAPFLPTGRNLLQTSGLVSISSSPVPGSFFSGRDALMLSIADAPV